jgi:hypothetical protein
MATIAQLKIDIEAYKAVVAALEAKCNKASRELLIYSEQARLAEADRDQQKRERDQFFVVAQRAETQRDEFDRQAERWRVKWGEEYVKRHRAEGAVEVLREILDRKVGV